MYKFLPSFLLRIMAPFSQADILPHIEHLTPSIHQRHRSSLHIAFLFGPRKILIASAMNKVGSRSSGAGYSAQTLHAERAVLKRVGDVSKLRNCTLVVIRIGVQGNLMLSKPCHECECHLNKCIRSYGLKAVYYSL